MADMTYNQACTAQTPQRDGPCRTAALVLTDDWKAESFRADVGRRPAPRGRHGVEVAEGRHLRLRHERHGRHPGDESADQEPGPEILAVAPGDMYRCSPSPTGRLLGSSRSRTRISRSTGCPLIRGPRAHAGGDRAHPGRPRVRRVHRAFDAIGEDGWFGGPLAAASSRWPRATGTPRGDAALACVGLPHPDRRRVSPRCTRWTFLPTRSCRAMGEATGRSPAPTGR